uniref:Uncharacterized protein n=1 Tax=Romanomermis culicivorax TaxID=13658 RepID=A0A915KQD7_ROMCU
MYELKNKKEKASEEVKHGTVGQYFEHLGCHKNQENEAPAARVRSTMVSSKSSIQIKGMKITAFQWKDRQVQLEKIVPRILGGLAMIAGEMMEVSLLFFVAL